MIKLGCDESLPKDWRWVKAQACMDVRDGTHDSPKYVEKGIPLVTSKNLVGGKVDFSSCSFISESDHIAISKRSGVCDGDILYAMIGTIGNPVIVEKTQDFSIKNVALFKFGDGSPHNRYIYHYLNSDLATFQFSKNSRGGTQKFVSLGNIRDLLIPLPPLSEQKRIAEILDKADNLRRKRQEAIQLADEFLRSVFLDMFGDPVTNPKGWQYIHLRDLITDWTPGVTIRPDEFTDNGFAVLHKGAVQRSGKLEFDDRKKTHTSREFAKSNSKAVIDSDYMAVNLRDLVPTGPSIGLMADLSVYGDKKYLLAYGAYGFKIKKNIVSPEYLIALTNHEGFRGEFAKVWVGSTQIHIRKDDFFDIKIPLPNYEIQKEYGRLVSECRAGFLSSVNSFCAENLFESLADRIFKAD